MKENSIYIERLKERLRHKPDSRLFLSLAEEYKKMDKIYAAIAILIEGINKNPEFIPARFALGRYYIECDMLSEAKKELSEIIERFPDNISVRKLLDEINKRPGLSDVAVSSKSRDASVTRLNKFLEAIKIRFAASN